MSTTRVDTATFRISALPWDACAPLFGLGDEDLAARGMRRVIADEHPGFPCRVSLADAAIGETLLLLHHVHHDVRGPFRASGPIYVREHAAPATFAAGEIPELLRVRLLSLRAYDGAGLLRDAEVSEGRELEDVVDRMFSDPEVSYLHAHSARPGCYLCRIDRA